MKVLREENTQQLQVLLFPEPVRSVVMATPLS